ncbi:MAG: M48 family metalloprotease [Gemmatimonadetes bacterium]|nr:M48 family metalloprotease [Gemmatimonadota bacterium]
MEKLKVFGLMAVLSMLMVMLGGYIGGSGGASMFFVGSLAINFGMYWFSDKIVLRQYRAHVVRPGEDGGRYDELYAMIDRLRQRAELPMPVVAVSEEMQPNAFATGRNHAHAVVCVTRGMWEMVQAGQMTRDELEGVMAHELAHVKHYHMLVGTVAASMAGAIMLIARMAFFFGGRDEDRNPLGMILMMILAPVAAMLIRAAISQRNEFEADAGGALISGKPLALASALQRIERMAEVRPMAVSPAASHLAIINPLAGVGGLMSAFRTHPPTEQRVARLQQLAANAHVQPFGR